jgi:hypothetical protein
VTLSIALASIVARVKNPPPEGTLSVGMGLAISGICFYGFIAVGSWALGLAVYAPFPTFWPVLFICGPGFFLPLEQEVGRALAGRRARGLGSGPLGAASCRGGLGVAGALALGALAFFPVFGLTDRLFDSHALLLYALAAGFAAYCAEHLARATLSGNGRFRAYGVLLAWKASCG